MARAAVSTGEITIAGKAPTTRPTAAMPNCQRLEWEIAICVWPKVLVVLHPGAGTA
jgi:hypothetical protein